MSSNSGRGRPFEIIDYSLDDKNSEGYRILSELSASVRNALDTLRKLAEENSLSFSGTMNVTGGQAKNRRWLEKKAFDCKINIETCNSPDSELTGNAAVALYGLGYFENLQEAAKSIANRGKPWPEKSFEQISFRA